MKNLKYEVWLNGVALSSVAPELFLSGIEYTPAHKVISTDHVAGRFGLIATQTTFDPATVKVSYVTKRLDGIRRQAIVNAVAAWAANGGTLMVSDRPDQQLHVVCTDYPAIPDACSFTDPISIVFQTVEQPFWEDITPAKITLTGTEGSGELFVPGNAPSSFADVTITPMSSLSAVTVTVGGTSITLEGLDATAGTAIKMEHTSQGVFRIRQGYTSILNKRTAGSSDDLLAFCGAPSIVTFAADNAVSVEVSVRGAWM